MAFNLTLLPPLNACLNSLATVLLLTAFICIRTGRRRAHGALMIAALIVSAVFLASYLTYHFNMATTKFGGQGFVRITYFAILFTHMPLAALVPPMAIMAIRRAIKGQFDRHRRLTRWLLPIWLYVSVTGVVIYLMLRPYYPS
jgi:uncharacterized membrane protein YozB (DUF420 family)